MKLLLYGEADHYATGAWCYADAARSLGHTVVTFDHAEKLDFYHKSMLMRLYRHTPLPPAWPGREAHERALMAAVVAESPDIIVVFKGLWVSAGTVREMRRTGAWVVTVNHDDFFTGNRYNWSPAQRKALPEYDYVFTTRRVNVAELRSIVRKVEFFPFAYHPAIHHVQSPTVKDRARYSSDVVFVGSWERERAELLNSLMGRVRARYSIWGPGWRRWSLSHRLRGAVRGGVLRGSEMALAIGCSNVALGFLRRENRDEYTQRTFEIPACGGVLLAERTPEHEHIFTEGVEAELFDSRNADELAAKVGDLLNDPSRREQIRVAGRQRVEGGHFTYADRIRQLLELYRS